jgi:hypothetical protein
MHCKSWNWGRRQCRFLLGYAAHVLCGGEPASRRAVRVKENRRHTFASMSPRIQSSSHASHGMHVSQHCPQIDKINLASDVWRCHVRIEATTHFVASGTVADSQTSLVSTSCTIKSPARRPAYVHIPQEFFLSVVFLLSIIPTVVNHSQTLRIRIPKCSIQHPQSKNNQFKDPPLASTVHVK